MAELIYDSMDPTDDKKSLGCQFWNYADNSDQIDIAVGYVEVGALAQLVEYVRQNAAFGLNLLVGMQFIEGFSRPQIEGLNELASILVETGRGNVYVTPNVRYHGKLYAFGRAGMLERAYVGSGNLSAIGPFEKASFELGVIVEDSALLGELEEYKNVKLFPLAQPIGEVELVPRIMPESPVADMDGVQKLPPEMMDRLHALTPALEFRLPLKTTPKSNLNVFFGAPRRNFNTQRDIPRPWYEAELIIPKAVTSQPGYPARNEVISVVTDDGFSFECKVSGDYSKNFRSTPSLSILGGFIKGRLESLGLLSPGEPVTKETLRDYGRDHIDLKYFETVNQWMLDFSLSDEEILL